MAYADSEDKQRGIAREPFVAQRILEYFKKQGMRVTMEKSSLLEDMQKHYDYSYRCTETQSFAKGEKMNEIKVDIKCGKTFTLVDDRGRNTLEHSDSTFIVFELEEGSDLLWVNTGKFKECLDRNGYELRKSKINNSKYFFIEDYIRKNQKFLGKFVKYIK
jgi:hypothetical protein